MIKKTAIIIGASSDIGIEAAKKFSAMGYALALTYHKNEVDFESILNSSDFKAYQLNLTNGWDTRNVFKRIKADFKTFDCLVFCAGIAQKRKLVFDITNDEIDDLFEINIKSAIRCIRDFSKIVVNKQPATITLVGSFVEKTGCSCESVYTATKSAMSGLAKSLATELGNMDIRINVVAPGFIDTKMNNNLEKEEKDEIASMTPLKRLGTASDVANAIYFLASDESSFITGQTLYVDGGLILE